MMHEAGEAEARRPKSLRWKVLLLWRGAWALLGLVIATTAQLCVIGLPVFTLAWLFGVKWAGVVMACLTLLFALVFKARDVLGRMDQAIDAAEERMERSEPQ